MVESLDHLLTAEEQIGNVSLSLRVSKEIFDEYTINGLNFQQLSYILTIARAEPLKLASLLKISSGGKLVSVNCHGNRVMYSPTGRIDWEINYGERNVVAERLVHEIKKEGAQGLILGSCNPDRKILTNMPICVMYPLSDISISQISRGEIEWDLTDKEVVREIGRDESIELIRGFFNPLALRLAELRSLESSKAGLPPRITKDYIRGYLSRLRDEIEEMCTKIDR
ncbi:hypothetical protein J4416_00190 [Candidatus Pacearchaeota archaeon]|nr:hypothetical protein [Candidatus Pacearchaeota archaeon]